MISFLFSPSGRFGRKAFWSATGIYLISGVVVAILLVILSGIIPGDDPTPGHFNVSGPAALPFLILIFAYNIFAVWSGICTGIKRFHDRDKSGWWVLITLIPIVGPIWYFVETACLRGTPGPNRFGPDPVTARSVLA